MERLDVPVEEIRICTGTIDEIGDTDLMADACPVRYIITVDKLREGWDCPLAYVLGSIGNAATPTAVEQLIDVFCGCRTLILLRVPALDRAYAFVLSDNIMQTAMQLRDEWSKHAALTRDRRRRFTCYRNSNATRIRIWTDSIERTS